MSACRSERPGFFRYEDGSLLDAALEAIGRAAMVVDASGNVMRANRVARASLAGDERSMRDAVRDFVCGGCSCHSDWEGTPVLANGHDVEYLVVARPPKPGIAGRLAYAERVWGLTPRQREVLAKIADGKANKIISATLKVSVRTVEVHLTALYIKAGVTSRAELLVKLLALE